MEKVEKALQNHKNGYNCAQSVACVYAKMLGMDEEAVFRLSEGFGLGMGSMETCPPPLRKKYATKKQNN